MSEDNPVSTAIRRCFSATEKEYMDAVQERDQLRELCAELLEALTLCNKQFKGESVISFDSSLRIIDKHSSLITKAEKALGESDGYQKNNIS